jgi:hypothetical protein
MRVDQNFDVRLVGWTLLLLFLHFFVEDRPMSVTQAQTSGSLRTNEANGGTGPNSDPTPPTVPPLRRYFIRLHALLSLPASPPPLPSRYPRWRRTSYWHPALAFLRNDVLRRAASELLTWWKLRETKFPLTPSFVKSTTAGRPTLSPGEREHRQPSWA